MPGIIKLTRKNKSMWEFEWNEIYNGYIHKTPKTIYKIFFDNCVNPSTCGVEPDIWIGRLIIQNGERFWVTCEREIKAQSLKMFRGVYHFN